MSRNGGGRRHDTTHGLRHPPAPRADSPAPSVVDEDTTQPHSIAAADRRRARETGPAEPTPPSARDVIASVTADELRDAIRPKGLHVSSALMTLVALAIAAALYVAGKADAGDVIEVRTRVRAVEDRSVRIEEQVRGLREDTLDTRRETRMLIRAIRPQLAEQLEPLDREVSAAGREAAGEEPAP